jgi:hypothetical protein
MEQRIHGYLVEPQMSDAINLAVEGEKKDE